MWTGSSFKIPKCYLHLLLLDNLEASKTDCQWTQWWERLAGLRLISALLSLLFSFPHPWLSLSLSPYFSCLPAPSCSRIPLSPSRLLIRNHQIVSVTMSSTAAKALVIIPDTQSKWRGGNGIFQLRCKAILKCGLARAVSFNPSLKSLCKSRWVQRWVISQSLQFRFS